MNFQQFALALIKIEKISSRLEMTAVLAEEIFPYLDENDCQACFNLLQGQLLPAYQSLEFQLSEKMVIRALARLVDQQNLRLPDGGGEVASGQDMFGEEDLSLIEKRIRRIAQKQGDLALAAEEILQLSKNHSNECLEVSLNEVYERLLAIARETGIGSQERKLNLLQNLLWSVDPMSARLIVRVVVGKMRLGFSLKTILDALSWYIVGDKSQSDELELAFQKKADLALLAASYLFAAGEANRAERLANYSVEVGVPVVPALCQRLNTATDIISKMETVIAEPKYDGMRVQIHFDAQGGIKAFTRSLEDISKMFPELKTVRAHLSAEVKDCIFDCEAVGYNVAEPEKLLAFQETITRRRKHDVIEKAAEIPMRFFIFDLLFVNGQSLIDQPLIERKKLLKGTFTENLSAVYAPYLITSDADELHQYHHQALADGLEGIVAKQIDAVYQSGRKGWSWVKIKEEEGTRGKLADTLDLVVMGYYFGRGKRAEFGVGAFLVGLRADEDSERILSLSKIGTGLTDEQFRELKTRADKLAVAQEPANYEVQKELRPDVWLIPEMIVEIAADEITNSSLHTSGVSLRFPRLVRWRDDKDLSGVTTLGELAGIQG